MRIAKKSILEKGRGQTRKLAKLEYLYEKEALYFAQAAESVKDLVLDELRSLNARDLKPVYRGVWFTASKADFYRIVYCSRLISRVLAPLVSFPCKDKDDLYRAAKKIHWEEFLTLKQTFSIHANVSEAGITHSNYAGLRVKDAIADYFRDRTDKRPSVDAQDPHIIFNVHIHKDVATLSVDASGGPLHKRGYREERVAAPMQETVAAAIIRLSGWDGSLPLYDPMCGSGTLLCEALMHYCRIPAQVFRTGFGFERLPDFDPDLWDRVREDARKAIGALPENLIRGSDVSGHSVHAARTNLMGLHSGGQVEILEKDFQEIEAVENIVIVTNPPYGIRMGKDRNMNLFYEKFGMFLRERCRGGQAYVYFGEPKYIKKMPLAPSWKRPLEIGGLDGKLVKYELYGA